MTETEKKALALVNEALAELAMSPQTVFHRNATVANKAICRAIEQHESFKREVSDAAVKATHTMAAGKLVEASGILAAFIIPKTNPLVEAMRDACGAQGIATKHTPGELTKHFRTALAARGGRIVWEGE